MWHPILNGEALIKQLPRLRAVKRLTPLTIHVRGAAVKCRVFGALGWEGTKSSRRVSADKVSFLARELEAKRKFYGTACAVIAVK